MAKRAYKKVLKTTIDPQEIGDDLIALAIARFMKDGRSEASAVRKMLGLCSLFLFRPEALTEALKKVPWLGDDFTVPELDLLLARAQVEASASQEVVQKISARSEEKPAETKPVEVTPKQEVASELKGSPLTEAPAASAHPAPNTPAAIAVAKPRSMLSGLKGMAISAPTIDPPKSNEAREVPRQTGPAAPAQSPAAMASAIAAKRANGREF